MARRYYSSTAQQAQLQSSINSTDTTIVVDLTTGFPASTPFTLMLDKDTINEEVVTCTNRSGTTLTIVRGEDGTSGVAHATGATVTHGFSARDLDEPNAHIAATQNVHGVTNVAGVTETQTLLNKTLTSPTITGPTVSNGTWSDPTFTGYITGLPTPDVDVIAKIATHNPLFSEAHAVFTMTSSTTQTLVLPGDATVAYPIGTTLGLIRMGTGVVSFSQGAGASVVGTPGLKLRAQYSAGTALKVANNTWVVSGDLSA